jgi:hypothetical protein
MKLLIRSKTKFLNHETISFHALVHVHVIAHVNVHGYAHAHVHVHVHVYFYVYVLKDITVSVYQYAANPRLQYAANPRSVRC